MYWRQLCRVIISWHSHKVVKSYFKPTPNHTANVMINPNLKISCFTFQEFLQYIVNFAALPPGQDSSQ